jgi:parvulin-like peptidyl-prolyl isomerase
MVNRKRPSVASLSLLLLGAGLAAPRLAGAEVLNRIVLRVNDRVATLYDYQKRKSELIQDTTHREQDPAERQRLIGQAGELVYKDMFDELLIESHADQLGVEATEQQVDAAVQQMRASNNLADDQQFAQALQQAGITVPQLREQLKNSLRVQEVINREVRSKVKTNEEDLRRYYGKHPDEFRVPDQLQLREVVVPEDKVPSAAERARVAGEMRRAILAGKPMAAASEPFHTQGEATGPTDLGWVAAGDLDPALAAAVRKLPKGGVSEPVPGRGGLHVIQVIDRREAHVKPFNEVSAAIQAKEDQRIFREKLTDFMADLQKQSLVVAQPPQEAAGFRKLISTGTQQPIPGLVSGDAAATAANPAPGGSATPAPGAPGAPGVTVPGPAAAPDSAPAPGSPGGLATPKPVDPTTPAPVIPPPAQSPPAPPPPSSR